MSKLHQIFVGCPFLPSIRKNYDRLKVEIEKVTPLHVVLADTMAISATDYLLEHITSLIRDSAGCVFDVSGGNPNVSLEVGIAHALPADFMLTFYTRKPRTQKGTQQNLVTGGEVRPIISDLQGRNRVEYKAYPALKDQLMTRYLVKLPYMKRWTEFEKRYSSFVKPALRVFDELRISGRTLRTRVVAVLDGTGIRADELLKALSSVKLVSVKRGRGGGIYYASK